MNTELENKNKVIKTPSKTKYAVVDKDNNIVVGSGSKGYAVYHALSKAQEKSLCDRDWRVVALHVTEVGDDT